MEHAFDIIFALDELVSVDGVPELVNITDLQTYTAMESMDEKLSELIRKGKEADENERRKKKALELDRQRLDRQRQAQRAAAL